MARSPHYNIAWIDLARDTRFTDAKRATFGCHLLILTKVKAGQQTDQQTSKATDRDAQNAEEKDAFSFFLGLK